MVEVQANQTEIFELLHKLQYKLFTPEGIECELAEQLRGNIFALQQSDWPLPNQATGP